MPNTRKTKRTMLVPIPQVEDPIQDKYNKDLNTWLKQFVEQLSNQEYGITITDDDEFSVPLAFTLQFDNTILTDEGNGLVVIDPLGEILNPSTGELEFPNNKVGIDGASSPGFLGNAEDTGVLRTTTPFTYTDNGNSITLGIQQSSTSTDGYLNNIDWDTFNDKADYLFGANSFSGTGDFFTTGDITAADLTGTILTSSQPNIDHDSLTNFVGDEHVAHSSIEIIAGDGLSGGGTIDDSITVTLNSDIVSIIGIDADNRIVKTVFGNPSVGDLEQTGVVINDNNDVILSSGKKLIFDG